MIKSISGMAALLLVAAISSCNNKSERKIAASIDGQPIYVKTVDKAVEREIYENLCDIYDIRLNATRELIGIRLLQDEAKKEGVGASDLIAQYMKQHADKQLSEERAREMLIDSLAAGRDIKIALRPPIAPSINTDSALAHSRGNINSKVVVTVVSDFDCGLCQTMHLAYNDLLKEYKDRVEFRHICFSDSVREATLAAEAAGMQGDYWAMHDTLMLIHDYVDDKAVENLAEGLGLDMEQFTRDYYSQATANAVMRSFAYLSANGADKTPMVLINNHPVRFATDKYFIAQEIERALNE